MEQSEAKRAPQTESIAEHARAYVALGWTLTTMPEGTKRPDLPGWNTAAQWICSTDQVAHRLTHGPQNLGLVHAPSGTCAIDVDDEAWTRHIFDEFGIDYDDVMGRGMRIRSKPNRDKAIFLAPELPLIKVSWPVQGSSRAAEKRSIFELRAGANQDVLPPSKHPDGHHYQWWSGTAPWELADLPQIPESLLKFWHALNDEQGDLMGQVQALCPWSTATTVAGHQARRVHAPKACGSDVIGTFNRANDLTALLQRHGYLKKGRRYLAPGSSTSIPGVVILEDKCFSHHGSDPLADGHAHDAFDVF
jgi:putative DNA primase/helicase